MYLKYIYHSKENNMRIQNANEFVKKLVMVYPTKCAYQLVYDKNYSVHTKIIQYFIIHGLGLCIRVDSYLAYMFYTWSFSHNTAVPIDINKNKYCISFNTNNNGFAWGAGNSNKNRI